MILVLGVNAISIDIIAIAPTIEDAADVITKRREAWLGEENQFMLKLMGKAAPPEPSYFIVSGLTITKG